MKNCHPCAHPSPAVAEQIPVILVSWMRPFRAFFTAPVWDRVLVLVMGAVLALGQRTVSAALRIMGLEAVSNFTVYHQVLNRARWSSRALARCLLLAILEAVVPDGPVVIGLDDTIERRWGLKIAARGIYRDPVRSSREHFVKTSGLRWLCLMILAPIPWAQRIWALPFLTVLSPSERYHADHGRRHKTLTDYARQAIGCVCRWLPNRQIIVVGDSSFAVLDLIAAVRHRCTVISRLRLDANLFAPPPNRPSGRRGRPRVKGVRLPKLKDRLENAATLWHTLTVMPWYGGESCTLAIASDVAVWYRSGSPPVLIRWVLVRDPTGERDPQAFFSTDTQAEPVQILSWFVRRWQMEVTFQDVRTHLGVESQRQWSDRAIARTTPALLGLYSLVTLWAPTVLGPDAQPRSASWYTKSKLTFSDAMAAIRYTLWMSQHFCTSTGDPSVQKIPPRLIERMVTALCYPA